MDKNAIIGLLKPQLDAHTMGVFALKETLMECGYQVIVGDSFISQAIQHIKYEANKEKIANWINQHQITHVGLSYRLDSEDALEIMHHFMATCSLFDLHQSLSGTIQAIFFAGLPATCQLINQHYPEVKTFMGYESIEETLIHMGVPKQDIPVQYLLGSSYDQHRLNLAKSYIQKQTYKKIPPNPVGTYQDYGSKQDHLLKRLAVHQKTDQSPLYRVHVGPYSENRKEALALFDEWLKQLKKTRYVDIVSLGTSQLTQSHFEQDWTGLANGGGLPVHNRQEYQRIYENSRPLLLRTYAGTKNVDKLALIHQESINICWHALSLWWFNQLDGRGDNDLLTNLKQHEATLKIIAATNKPFEANVSHHFAFRGADDTTYVVATVLSAMLAKKHGVNTFIFQNMLNTPRYTFGIMDLAKSQATLTLLRRLEDSQFQVLLQPRAGLDYFAPDLEFAKEQLAAVSMLMDDIEPNDVFSPPLVHVVSYSEALFLATPPIIDESIQISKGALHYYRELKAKQLVRNINEDPVLIKRRETLIDQASKLIDAMVTHIPNALSATGFYYIFASGFLPVPSLYNSKESFPYATAFKTKMVDGGVDVVNQNNQVTSIEQRIQFGLNNYAQLIKERGK